MSASPLAHARYRARQSLRVGWYGVQYAITRRIAGVRSARRYNAAIPNVEETRRSLRDLFDADWANIEAGLYPAPKGWRPGAFARLLADTRRYFEDLPKVTDRRNAPKGGVEVRDGVERGRYPTYYVQNFHFQSDGWMSERSARLYDTQVEVLFAGAADAMRRAALAEVAEAIKGRDQRSLRLLDVACGAGRFLEQVLEAFPRLQADGLDLSAAYLDEAARRLRRWPQARLIEANAEAAPIEAGSYDIVTTVYLFHELPPRVRPIVARELARLVKPGGLVVFADSIQAGDDPNLDRYLEAFPQNFHEPYYGSYCGEDLDALFTPHGLERVGERRAYLTKVVAYRRV